MCEISIIIPVYNVEKYIERCLKSILEQSFTDYEIILVEDGTLDMSGLICDRYALKYPFIHVIHQNNKGLALSRKVGVDHAVGNYIMFIDSDDWIHRDTLRQMHRIMLESKSEIVCCQYTRVNEKGKQKLDTKMKEQLISCQNPLESAYQMFVTRYLKASACGKLIYAPLLKNVDFKGNLAIGEEHDMVTQLLSLAKRVSIMEKGYYYYYWRTDSISHAGYNEKYYNSFNNYLHIRDKAIIDYIALKPNINAYFAEFEMSVVTAMGRNKTYDWNVVHKLQKELRETIKDILCDVNTPFYLKVCASMIIISPRAFLILFRIIHTITGR